ncbi:hypothetical protein Agabi119p4_4958 [Agaricus bisporus var. burnettii]|uniref:Uncharacterized protein n=1 Tax=Agaricus bisporus var. burnettii TaxID=192524 RepID=A0A8H7KHT5_AGABI|nr:hypothetical protein Agabi119p4_4958 [Agaricus bisporus var. burnettii]
MRAHGLTLSIPPHRYHCVPQPRPLFKTAKETKYAAPNLPHVATGTIPTAESPKKTPCHFTSNKSIIPETQRKGNPLRNRNRPSPLTYIRHHSPIQPSTPAFLRLTSLASSPNRDVVLDLLNDDPEILKRTRSNSMAAEPPNKRQEMAEDSEISDDDGP